MEYKGRIIQRVDHAPVTDGQRLRIVFESVNSDWNQGIYLRTDGSFEVNEQVIPKATVLWHHTAPREVLLRVRSRKGECFVKNVWDTGDGAMDSGHNCAAMLVEESGSIRRYRCNDARDDDDFDYLVFTLERIDQEPKHPRESSP